MAGLSRACGLTAAAGRPAARQPARFAIPLLFALFSTACMAVHAPDFPAGHDWLNTGGQALSLADVRGKVVLVDFWTYGCVNCLHVIPMLKRFEARYASELVVIGIHSAKFAQEGRTANLRKLVLRYGLEHPVVNDADYAIWNLYGVRAWPTLVLIDPAGRIVGQVAGEGNEAALRQAIDQVIAEFDRQGKLDRAVPNWPPERLAVDDSPLLFPGKVFADGGHRRLFISDSNHHRIVVADFSGEVQAVIGGGGPGRADGDFHSARFFQPQGLTLAGDHTLYVADTENHLLRHVDLDAQQVSTVAGTGQQTWQAAKSGPALHTAINSPWDVLYDGGLLYIAMAGQHQIWIYDPVHSELREFAGSRREELRDGPRLMAGFNQPSGLALAGGALYVADSEASAIRRTGLGPEGAVTTLVGTGLFDFGDRDGAGAAALLQHPLGLAVWPAAPGFRLLIADTYNSKLKWLDLESRAVTTIPAATGQLDEPGGLSVAAGRVWIADTNHHAIKVFDPDNNTLAELTLHDPRGLLQKAL